MGRYSSYRQVRERKWKIHPVWRGIGCFLLVLVPIMSYAAAIMVAQMNQQYHWMKVPPELAGSFNLAIIYKYIPELARVIPRLGRIYYLHVGLMSGFMVVGFGSLTMLYSLMYRMTGVKRYGPVDAPPIRRSPHRRPR